MIGRLATRGAAIIALWIVVTAHVGTLDSFFAGMAGPWRVQVTVRPPGIVPGRAEVLVRVSPPTAAKVTLQAAQWDVGTTGAPPPDAATRVPGNDGLWSSDMWLMTSGSYALHVVVDGELGVGTVIVPVTSLAIKRLGMQTPLGIVLLALGAFLVVGMVSIVGAAIRDGELVPGEATDDGRLRRARFAMAISGVAMIALLTGGWTWWNAVDRAYARGIFKPLHATATVRTDSSARVLRVTFDDSTWRAHAWTPLVPDHGKMMHLFLVREPAMDVLAHLHPTLADSSTFDAKLGALPAGAYRVYGDVVHESGLAQTITTRVQIAEGASDAEATARGDRDDAIARATTPEGDAVRLASGVTVTWMRPKSLDVRDDGALRFVVRDANGKPASLEPYMGMPAHAVVVRDDGGVFVHLHSMGSVSTASQAMLDAVERGDTLAHDSTGQQVPRATMRGGSGRGPLYVAPRPNVRADSAGMTMAMSPDGVLAFPFAFPEPGRYRVWVQFRRAGAIETASFPVKVGDAR